MRKQLQRKQLLTPDIGKGKTAVRLALYSVLFLSLALVLNACQAVSRFEMGMVETNNPNRTQARFQTFTGRKARQERLEAGETLSLQYEATVEEGTLTLQVENPDGESIWQVELAESDSDEVSVAVEQTGPYTIVIQGDNAGGSYQIDWNRG